MTDHYRLLQVRRDASAEVIAAAYRRLMRDAHPDRGGDAELARRLNGAYEVLSDPSRLRAYDRTLAAVSSAARQRPLMETIAYRIGAGIGRRAAQVRTILREVKDDLSS